MNINHGLGRAGICLYIYVWVYSHIRGATRVYTTCSMHHIIEFYCVNMYIYYAKVWVCELSMVNRKKQKTGGRCWATGATASCRHGQGHMCNTLQHTVCEAIEYKHAQKSETQCREKKCIMRIYIHIHIYIYICIYVYI